jgi:outer membrane protein assembly factor BamA
MAGLAMVLCMGTSQALAQSDPPTRAEAAQQAREAKAAAPIAAGPGRVERVLNTIERSPMFAPRDGFGLRVGTIDGGGGLAAGPSWRKSNLFGGRLQMQASGAVSTLIDHEVQGSVAVTELGTHRLAFLLGASRAHLAQNRFFGIGALTNRVDQTAFTLDRNDVTATVTLDATGWLEFAASAGTVNALTRDGKSPRIPPLSSRFGPSDAIGFNSQTSLAAASLSVAVDYRDVPLNPRSGGRYQVAMNRYLDRMSNRYSFTRIEAELEQHVSFWRRQRLVTLRAMGSTSIADPGHDVPFFMQQTLGGSTLLRGFLTDRFRDLNVMAVQAEYGWDILPFVNAVLFYEAGAVTPRWQDITLRTLKRDYGLGFRFGSARTVALRTDVAFGSGEGTRLTMRFNHAF